MGRTLNVLPHRSLLAIALETIGAARPESRCGPVEPRAGSDGRPRRREALRGMFREVLGERPLRILDVGTGDGEAALLLDELGHYPHGVDRSAEMVRLARRKAAARCAAAAFRVGDAENLDFQAGSFDAVHASRLLETLPHPMWALGEWFRVLRPGGIVMTVEDAAGADRAADGLHDADLLRAAGFTGVQTRDLEVESRASRGSPWRRFRLGGHHDTCSIAWGLRG